MKKRPKKVISLKTNNIYILILLLLISCQSEKNKRSNNYNSINNTTINKIDLTKIQFDFKTAHAEFPEETIEINASIINKNSDTIYLLSTSCSGAASFFHYDTVLFEETKLLNCNATWPIIIKIPPFKHFNFTGLLLNKKKVNKITLGYYLKVVDKSFDVSNLELYDAYKMILKNHNIIWAKEKTIN